MKPGYSSSSSSETQVKKYVIKHYDLNCKPVFSSLTTVFFQIQHTIEILFHGRAVQKR